MFSLLTLYLCLNCNRSDTTHKMSDATCVH